MREDDSDLVQLFAVMLFLLVFFLTSCVRQEASTVIPKFKFGSPVYVSDGFYKGCKGYIYDFYEHNNSVRYTVDADCPWKKTTFSRFLNGIDENILVENLSD